MAKRAMSLGMCVAVFFMLGSASFAETAHRIGVGAHYWKALSDVDVDEVDESGVAWVATYQYRTGALLNFEADVEVLPSDFGGADGNVFLPQAYVIVGQEGLYAALGIGSYFADSKFNGKFYALRLGFDIALLPFLMLDINANYRFEDWDSINSLGDDVGTDTITLGAAVRIEL